MRGSRIPKEELESLYYDKKLSMQEIATYLGCSLHKVAYWMDQYGFERRNWSEATYVQRNPDGDPFRIRMPETPSEWALFGVGIGLYMGEGTKTGWAVSIANTNPGIHRAFISFLEQICGVCKAHLRADLNIYDDCDIRATILWWSEQLGLQQEQFCEPYVQAAKGGSYTRKSMYGTLTVRFGNFKLKKIIEDWCSEFYK